MLEEQNCTVIASGRHTHGKTRIKPGRSSMARRGVIRLDGVAPDFSLLCPAIRAISITAYAAASKSILKGFLRIILLVFLRSHKTSVFLAFCSASLW